MDWADKGIGASIQILVLVQLLWINEGTAQVWITPKRIGISTVVTGMYAQNLLLNLEQETAPRIFFCGQEI